MQNGNELEYKILGVRIWKIFAYFIIYSVYRIYSRNSLWN